MLGFGTSVSRITSYQPQAAFPREAMAEEIPKRIQAGRKRLSRVRA